MFQERTLLERLSRPDRLPPRTLSENTQELTRSILKRLRLLLNSRQGLAPAQLDFGIPEPSEVAHSFPEAIGRMQRAIVTSIEKYEPRLTSVKAVHVESEEEQFTLRFQITAQLRTAKERTYVCFDTLLDASGRIQVKA
jgi:type VI secretion system protein